jgi:hypothetical protein
MHYWQPKHTLAVGKYIRTTSTIEKNRIIDRELYKPLTEMAVRALTKNSIPVTDDNVQDILIHLVCKVLPKVSEEKMAACLQYLFTASSNYVKTYLSHATEIHIVSLDTLTRHSDDDPEGYNIYCSETYIQNNYMSEETGPATLPVDLDAASELQAVHKKILAEIDLRLKGQHIVNTTNSVFLLLLRQYIVDNDFDVRGFGTYVMNAMHLKLATYRVICGRVGLRTKDFNEKLLKEHKPKKKRIR